MAEVKTTCREELLAKLREDPVWDVVVIGGGATGAMPSRAQMRATLVS